MDTVTRAQEGAKHRAKPAPYDEGNAALTRVKRVGIAPHSGVVTVEYGDGQMAQFEKEGGDMRPTLRNPNFMGFPLKVVWTMLAYVELDGDRTVKAHRRSSL